MNNCLKIQQQIKLLIFEFEFEVIQLIIQLIIMEEENDRQAATEQNIPDNGPNNSPSDVVRTPNKIADGDVTPVIIQNSQMGSFSSGKVDLHRRLQKDHKSFEKLDAKPILRDETYDSVGGPTPIQGNGSRLESRGNKPNPRIQVPIKGTGARRDQVNGTDRNSESRTMDHEDWEAAPRFKPLGPSNKYVGEVEIKKGPEMKLRKNMPVKADHSQVIGMKNENRVLNHAAQSAGQRVFNHNEDETRLNQSYVDRVLAMEQPKVIDHQQNNKVPGSFGTRNQSVDVAAYRRGTGIQPVAAENSIFSKPKQSLNQSHISGYTLANNSVLIEEVKKNNFTKISKIMEQFIVSKNDSGTITGRESQQRQRSIKNSFQPMMAQRKGSHTDRSSTKFTDEYPGAVGPKVEIAVPKNLILYQLSKNVDAAMVEQSITAKDNSFMEYMEQSDMYQHQHGKSPFAAKSLRTIEHDPNSLMEALNDQLPPKNLSTLRGDTNPSPGLSPTPNEYGGVSNFHITDLLERSIILGAAEREQNKLKQIVEFYKRSVKNDKDINTKKEILIRNYRLHVVKDVEKEFDEETRSLLTLNKGTCIHVSNSIIKPEIHKFRTKLTDVLTEVYPQLLEDLRIEQESPLKAAKKRHFDRRAQSMLSGISALSFIQPEAGQGQDNEFFITMLDEEQRLINEEEKNQKIEDEQLESLAEERSRAGGSQASGRTIQIAETQQFEDLDTFIADGTESRPFTAVDAAEFDAVNKTNKIFDRWLRNLMSQQSGNLESPRRPVLKNGRLGALRSLDINWQITLNNGGLLKEKPLPQDRLTTQSFYDDTPYRYLQMLVVNQDIREWYSKFVLKSQDARNYDEIINNSDKMLFNFQDAKIAIDFQRHHLTHLDPLIFPDDNLPTELFLDYEMWIRDLAKAVRKMQVDTELAEKPVGIEANTDYFLMNGTKEVIPCKVIDFDPLQARFFVKNDQKNLETWRSRLFIRLINDDKKYLDEHRIEVMNRKAETLHYLRLHRLILKDLTKRYPYLRLSNQVLQKIQNKIKVDLRQYSPDSVRKLILQIEALYVFSILKATLSSQRQDPFIKGLLQKFKVPIDSPALSYFKPHRKEKIHLPGIENFNMKGIKMELDNNSLLLTDEKYIKLPIFLKALTDKTINAHRLFIYPFNVNLILAQGAKEFRKMTKDELTGLVNQFPLHHDKFVQAQALMSKFFHQIARFKWAEAIQQEIWTFVKDDFDFELGKELTEDQIDPSLMRLFYQLKLYMQTVIFDHFESALRDYMRFLLSFILRDQEIKESKIVDEIKYNPWIRLSLKESLKMQFQKGEMVNDIDLIPLRNKPMILIGTQIDDIDIPNQLTKKKQKVVTKPDLETVTKDLFSVIQSMHSSLQDIDRIDGIIFPLLKLEDPFLLVPDVKTNEKLSHYIRIIERLIDQCLKPTKKELVNIGQYMYIFDRRVDGIILDLKKRSFMKAQDDMSDGETPNEQAVSSEGEKSEKQVEGSGEEEYDDEDDEEEEGDEEGYQGNDMAYKSVEIDDNLMKEELYMLRGLRWKILDNVHDTYDFGMVYLDCVKFKDRIMQHIKDLILHLESFIRNDFTNKQKAIQQEIVGVEGKLDMTVESIDDVIMLLDYIDSLGKQDNKIGDISIMIDDVSKRMDYIEQVEILFPDVQYSEFLNIRNWPRTFKQYIEDRKQELLAKKDDLYQEMKKEIDEVFEKIKGFKEVIGEVLVVGLVDRDLTYDAEDNESVDSMDSQKNKKKEISKEEQAAKDAEEQRQLESADGKTFSWIAKEINMDHMIFDRDVIELTFNKIEMLKQQFDDVEKATALINKRETLLGVAKTSFKDLRVIQDDLKPLYELWLVSSKFNKTLPVWVEGKFDQLDAGLIEGTIDEWINELKRLQKTNLIADNAKQGELQKFMFDSLTHFKRYGPMLRTLRTKGLAPRHWRMIGAKLDFMIDPSNITLYRLIYLKLYDEEKLKTIKQICEIATKEYGVQMALEQLDKELRVVEFEFQLSSDGETFTVLKLPDLIAMFEEFYLRASVLKTNPHIKNFFEKLLEVEKIIKAVVEIINEWTIFQRNFVYLNGIFVLEEIQKNLPQESKFFAVVYALYQTTTAGWQNTESDLTRSQIWRLYTKENFLSVLMKNNIECEIIRNGLIAFLERKRGKFPRLFFLSNEELVDIFGKGVELIEEMLDGDNQGFVSTLYEGIDIVKFHPVSYDLTHMRSKEGEEVHLIREVGCRHATVDMWLKQLETSMVLTVKDSLFLAFEQMGLQDVDEWVASWPGQATFVSSQIWFSMKIISIFAGSADRERAKRYAGGAAEGQIENVREVDSEDEDENDATPMTMKESIANQDEEADLKDEKIYQEEVQREIVKLMDGEQPEKGQLEKILRLKLRFRVNKSKSAAEQFEKLLTEIQQMILLYTSMVRKRLANHTRKATEALLTGYVHFRDILYGLMKDRVYKQDDFKWQVQFKFELKNSLEVVFKSAYETGGIRRLETNKVEVDMECLGNIRSYGFEYLGNCQRLVCTPLTERCQRSLLVALQYQYGGAPEGPFGTGKTETTKDLSRTIGKMCYVLNCSANYEYAGVVRFFKGLASAGAWVTFDEFNRMDTNTLSLISQIIVQIQTAIRNQQPHLQLDEAKIILKSDCAIFITLNPGYAGRSDLPMNLKTLFRPVSMVAPDSIFITEILLYSAGFIGAQQLARKIVSVQKLANVIMSKADIAHDFGLRSIKAIVSIAETLKLQAQNIMDSDLTEIIDDYSMEQIPYKSSQIINDIMMVTQDRIARVTDPSYKGKGTFGSGGDELVKIDELNENDEDKSPMRKTVGQESYMDQKSGRELSQIGEQIKGQDSMRERRDSIMTMPDELGEEGRNNGFLYRKLWGRDRFTERQLKTVYRQIGIDPEIQYDEEELEEYIILKAVRDFNHSKFAIEEHIIIEGIIKDIFQGAVPDLDKPIQDYGNLKDAIHQSFELCKIDYSANLRLKALQFYEIQRSKHGCIIMGEPQSGKSTLIFLLQSALNKAALNEYMLTVSEKRRERLLVLAHEYENSILHIAQQNSMKKTGNMSSGDMIGGAVKKKSKKNDKDVQAKKLLQQWQDMYRQTKLNTEEYDEIRKNLINKGVSMRRVNPKAMTMDELFGTFDKNSHEWHEGIFTKHYRDFSLLKDDKKKWILLDGPIDSVWVENLNSILDDNKRMSLPNGESLKMSNGMCILLETNSMKNVTPATVSRCGLIHLHRRETCNPKAIFNKWLRNLPPNIIEYAQDLEKATNYLMVEAIEVFVEEKKMGRISYHQVDLHWLMQNFVRLLSTMIYDFYIDYEKTSAVSQIASNPNELGKSLQNMNLGNTWVDLSADPNMTVFPDEEDAQGQGGRPTGSQHSQHRVQTPDPRQREMEKKKRLPRCSFIENELRYENGLKFTAIWLESFIVFCMVWTFYPILSEAGRKRLDEKLRAKYETARTDYGVYQKDKKKKLAEKNKEKSLSNKNSIDGKSFGRTPKNLIKKSITNLSDKGFTTAPGLEGSMDQSQAKQVKREFNPNFDGYTPTWTDKLDEKPMLISDYPQNSSFFDYYFNLESNGWAKFSLEMTMNDAQAGYLDQVPSQKKFQNFFVPSKDLMKYSFLLECLVTTQVSTIVIGPAGSGRSTLMKETLFNHVFNFTKQLITDHVTMSSHTDSTQFKDNVEKLLEWRLDKKGGTRKLRPHLDNKLICYVEDLHMGFTDSSGDQPAIEAIRDYLTSKAWLSSRKRLQRDIEDLSIFACLSINAPQTGSVSGRVLHQFNVISLDEPEVDLMKDRFNTVTNLMVLNWPSSIQMYASNIVNTIIDINMKVQNHLKPTPMKAHYTFTWRDIKKILMSVQMIESNSLKVQKNVMKLIYHEAYRNYGDRLIMTHDKKWFKETLEEVCRKNFWVVEVLEDFGSSPGRRPTNKPKAEGLDGGEEKKEVDEIDPKKLDQFLWPIEDPDQLFYSSWNQEVEGFYMEVDRIDDIQKVIESNLERHNDSNERIRIDLMLFNQINRLMLKMLRVIQSPGGHLINVAMKGHGMKSIIKLVTFATNHSLKELEVYEGYNLEEWHNDLRRCIIQSGNDNKPVTLYVDEYQMVNKQMYVDLECVLKNYVCTEITRKPDIIYAMANIFQQIDAEKTAAKFGLSAPDDGDLTKEQREDRDRQETEQKHDFIADNKKMMLKYPQIQAELYKVFLNRIKNNFHLIMQYTPTGGNFREKIATYKELMYLSQMIFMSELPASELESLGHGFFKAEYQNAVNKSIINGSGIVKEAKYSMSNDTNSKERVLQCIVKMYLQTQEITKKYAEEQGQIIYITPTMYLRVFNCFTKLLKERQEVVKEIAIRYEEGLEKIKKTQEEIYRYHQDLETRSPILKGKLLALAGVIADIFAEFEGIQGQRDQLKRDEFEAEQQTDQALSIKEQCEETLNKIIPSLNEAMNSVQTINKYDLAELRSMKKPPKVVKLVLQTVCMILEVKPEQKKSKKNGKMKLSYWKAAQGKEVLGNPNFSDVLQKFDRNKLTPEIMMEVEDILTNGNYSYEKARTAAVAATGIFKWVKATRDYFYIFKEIEPRRDAFMLSQKQYEEKKNQLVEKTSKIGHLDIALEGLKVHQNSKDSVISDLRAEIQDCSIRMKRADALLKGLSAEKQKWIVCTRMLTSKYSTVTGDVLLSAGYITLISGFNQRYRNKIIQKWAKSLGEDGFPCSKEFIFTELFGDSYKIRKWHMNLLPTDHMSVNNALVIEKTKRFVVVIDPQVQGQTWLKNQYDSFGTLATIRQDDPQFKKTIEMAVELGRTVIVENVSEEININLRSLMKKQVSKYGGQRMILFCRKSYKFDKNFRCFIMSNHSKPHFDVNVTNHVTLVNFSVNIESLQAQMLSIVVLNERKDLDDVHSENSKEAFDSIKSLKDIERGILELLENPVSELLGDDRLIEALQESKNTAEYVASKLKNIAQTNQFLQKAREVYSPVAFRAAILYFVVKDLQKVNSMYQFSLTWLKNIFAKSLEMTNVTRDDPGQLQQTEEGAEEENSLQLLNNNFSVDERIDLLTRTFTQELYKKLQMAIFEEDKKLVTCIIVMRVMESESFIDRNLFQFLLSGPKSVQMNTQVPQEINDSPWLTSMIWADLKNLSTMKPFNSQNLLGHFTKNSEKWNKYYNTRDKPLTFDMLPNKSSLDLRYFSQLDEDELFEETGQFPQINRHETQSQHLKGTDAVSMAGRTAGDTHSRIGSRAGMRRTESEILNDAEIWNISDSDDEFQPVSIQGKSEDDKNSKRTDSEGGEQPLDKFKADMEMARYLVDNAPSTGGNTGGVRSNINSLRKKTQSERQLILRRESAIKGLSELCILRCIRPDQLNESMDRFILNILDPNYFDFTEDLLNPMRNKGKISESALRQETSQNNFSKKSLAQSKMGQSKMSGIISNNEESQKVLNASRTVDSRLNVGASDPMNQSQVSIQTKQSHVTTRKVTDQKDKQKKARGGANNIKNLIAEAYEDSDERSPIFFLIATAGINILDLITEFHNKKVGSNSSIKLSYFSLGKGLEEMINEGIAKAAQSGDWIILENLHLADDWLPSFEERMSKWKGSEVNPRFRCWITCIPVDNFPASILERSIKVALQPPKNIKSKIQKMLLDQEKDSYFRKSGKNGSFHKNLFFGLAYFHSIMDSRGKYGTLGWHVPYKFDFSDFDISNAQLSYAMKHNSGDLQASLEMLKYYFSQINYAGKIQRQEDQITLNAILSDVFNDKISFAVETKPDLDASHYGFPPDNIDFLSYWDKAAPETDSYQIFGLSWNIEASLLKKDMFTVLNKIYNLEQNRKNESVGNDNQNTSIEMNSLKSSLRSGNSYSGGEINQMLNNNDSVLNLFTAMQKLLNTSSLDKTVTDGGKRYDLNIDQEILPLRDLNDQKVTQLAKQLLIQIDAQFDADVIQQKFPIKYKAPLNNCINRELCSYKILLNTIKDSVKDLLDNIDGNYPRPLEIEDLWNRIQANKIPKKWLLVSFQTGYDSLADYLVELGLKLEFWKKIVNHNFTKEIPSFWLPAFYDPKSFLTCLIQTRSRYEEIPMKDLRNDYEFLDHVKAHDSYPIERNVTYFYGLILDGADWNFEQKLLVESTKAQRFTEFPVIKVRTVKIADTEQGKKVPKNQNGEEESQSIQKYKCPLFKTTQRLAGMASMDNVSVEVFKVNTLVPPNKWKKLSVALLLEADRKEQ